jgi:hypothetical protein
MGKPLGKASACLREAASAKAGANLLLNKHEGFRPLLEYSLVLSSVTLTISN